MNLSATLHLESAQFRAALAAVQTQLAGVVASLSAMTAGEGAVATAGGVAAGATAGLAASTATTAGAATAATAALVGLTGATSGAGAASLGAASAAGITSAALGTMQARALGAAAAMQTLRAAATFDLARGAVGATLALPARGGSAGGPPRLPGVPPPIPVGGGGGAGGGGAAAGLALGGLGGLGSVGMLGGIAATVAALGGFTLAVGGVRRAVGAASEMEDFETSFITLLGSAEAARDRMAELAQFGHETPFDLPEVVAASRVLETLTRGALSTGEGLRMVGDIAANTGQPFAEIAMWVGRLYDGLQNGRPVGEALMRLQELGIVTGDVRARIEGLQQAGKRGDEVWSVAANAFGRFAGEMERRSGTFNGMMSNLRDGIDEVWRAFGAPVADALKPLLADAMALMEQLRPIAAEVGEAAATAIWAVREAIAQERLGELASAALQVGFAEAAHFLFRSLQAGWAAQLAVLSTGDFWAGLGNGVLAALQGVGAGLIGVFGTPLAFLTAGVETAVQTLAAGVRSAFAATPWGKALEVAGVDVRGPEPESFEANFTAAQAAVQDLVGAAAADAGARADAAVAQITAAAEAYVAAYTAAFAGADDAIDTTELREKLAAIVADLLAGVERASEDAAPGLDGATDPLGAIGKKRRGRVDEPEADRLAKIGGFIGPQGGPQAEHAKKTADNTGKLVGLAEKNMRLIEQLARAPAGTAWA
ncbi:hypothetical protein ASA1KI_21290 [Opitutales bacterium ASA1]|uniref:hypothetical protein n=1 Tax=Congregicoccus parvus TaxID=3081749 RepID=UPI002B2A5957|nr:hypothetical protein ASA1KI_21290 [Opitutales bacterium ASA1]